MKNNKWILRIMSVALALTLVLTAGFTSLRAEEAEEAEEAEVEAEAEDQETEETELYNEDGTINDPEQAEIDENKLVFWSLFAGGDGSFMDEIIEAFNATNPAKEVQSVMLVWADYYTKLTTAVAADKGPDIGVSHVSKLPWLYEDGIVAPLNEYADASEFDFGLFTDAMVESVTFDDEIYAMPLDTHAEILFFNRDLMEEAGVELVDGLLPIESWDDFTGILDQVKENVSEDVTPISLTNNGDDPYRVWWALYFQMGGTPLLSEEGDEVTLDRDIAIEALTKLISLYDDGYIKPGIADHQKLFQSGQGALSFGGTWAEGVYEQTEGLNFGAQAFPQLFDQPAAWADAHTLTLPTNGRRSEEDSQAAFDFLKFATTDGATIWAKSGQIPSNLEVVASDAFTALPNRANYAASGAEAVLPPSSPNFEAMRIAMMQSLDEALTGQMDIDAAIDQLIGDVEAEIF